MLPHRTPVWDLTVEKYGGPREIVGDLPGSAPFPPAAKADAPLDQHPASETPAYEDNLTGADRETARAQVCDIPSNEG